MSQQILTSSGALVLGVDDEAANLSLLSAIIGTMGLRFMAARSGAECLEVLRSVSPRIILLDVMMPEMDGFETCRLIREKFPNLDCRIIFQTALNSEDDVCAAIKARGDDYLVKPIRPDVLKKHLNRWLAD
jgi:CheY-like chemotaxis protein